MSKKDKALDRIRNNPKNVRFEDLQAILEDFGFSVRHRTGSHAVFFHGKHVVVVPFRKPFVKVAYVRLALTAIDDILADSAENPLD
jgi:predicted RNA binding protein YcfA (HicA-like mRNA interferase family)